MGSMNYTTTYKTSPTENDAFTQGINSGFISRYAFLLLILASLAIDFFTPYLMQARLLPNAVRFTADAVVLALIILLMLRVIVFNKIPAMLLLILGITLIWGVVAFGEGQPLVATAWGWWRLFKFPILGVLTFLQPFWVDNSSEKLRRFTLYALQLNVLLQILEYLGGEVPGDNLAGFFGRHGVGALLLFIMFALCLAFGRWLDKGRWDMMIWVFVLGAISSGLGEMKFFPFGVAAIGLMTFVLQLLKGRQFQKLFVYTILLTLLIFSFGAFYNKVVAEANGSRRLEEYLDLDTLDAYLNRSFTRDGNKFYIGRGLAVQLGWQSIQRDNTTLLFGMGIGSRSESVTLGVVGEGLSESYYGLASGSSLMVLMQELGVGGLTLFGLICLIIILHLWNDLLRFPESEHNTLRYAIILLTLMWPMWLWYTQTWIHSVFMTLYWATLGYLWGYARQQDKKRKANTSSYIL